MSRDYLMAQGAKSFSCLNMWEVNTTGDDSMDSKIKVEYYNTSIRKIMQYEYESCETSC